jgi:hypothetical protein
MQRFITAHIFLTIFLFSFGHIGRISFLGQEVNLYMYEITLVLTCILLGFRYKFDVFVSTKLAKIISLFLAYFLVSYLISIYRYSFNENTIALLYFLRLAMYFIYFIYLAEHIHHTKESYLIVWKGLIYFIIFTIVSSTVQYLLYPDLRNLFYLGWDPHQYRLFGLFFDPPIAGAIYGILFIIIFFYPHIFKYRWVYYSLLITLFIGIVLTFSRGTYLGLIAVSAFYLFKKKLYKVFFAIICIFVLFLLVIPKQQGESMNLLRTFTIGARLEDYQEAIRIWQKQPIMGIGYNHIRYEKEQKTDSKNVESVSHAGASFHSSFLILLVTGGMIGLGVGIVMLWMLGKTSEVSSYIIVLVSVMSLTDNVFLHPFVLFLMLICISLRSHNVNGLVIRK